MSSFDEKLTFWGEVASKKSHLSAILTKNGNFLAPGGIFCPVVFSNSARPVIGPLYWVRF